MKKLTAFILALLCAAAVLPAAAEEEGLYIRAVENLPEDFLMGMDVSSVLSLEASGVTFRDQQGATRDLFSILAENGVNLIRVRVWNDPYDAEGHGYGGGNNDINAAVEIGRRATAAGMRLLVDFHYSDFWADPSKQMVPKAWAGMKIKEKVPVVREWTADCLRQLRDAGVDWPWFSWAMRPMAACAVRKHG